MLRIHFSTGTAWTKTALVEGTLQDDLLKLIEEYVMEYDHRFIKYDYTELLEIFTEEEINEQFLPINGGEYYINTVTAVEQVEIREYFKGKKVKDLTNDEREYLQRNISGDYMMDDGKNKEGMTEVTIDFKNGLSVAGWYVWEDDCIYYEFDENAVIYDAGE